MHRILDFLLHVQAVLHQIAVVFLKRSQQTAPTPLPILSSLLILLAVLPPELLLRRSPVVLVYHKDILLVEV